MTHKLLTLIAAMAIGCTSTAHAADSKMLDVIVDHGVSMTLTTPATSVFIANPEVADVQVMSPTSIMIFGKRTGETTFMATDAGGHTLVERTINVTQDLSSLVKELQVAIPGSHIKVASVPAGILLTGDAHDPASIADAYKLAQRYVPATGGDIINRVHVVGSDQIQIRVRFAEVQRNIDNSLGIDWNSALSYGGFAFGLASGASFMTAGSTAITRPNNTSLATPNDTFGIQRSGGRTNLNAIIDALAQDGLVSILAEPTLTAKSGETANFLAGGEFPIVIPQGNGGSTTYTVEFKSYGVSLAFTPTIIGENRVSLHVKPEVSQLTQTGAVVISNVSIPALTTRRAETTVEVGSGQSFAIAGLMDNSQSETVNKFPVVGDLPIIGALFRSSHFQSGQSELIVIITPYIVKPTNDQLALPTDGYSPPSVSDRALDLRYNSSSAKTRTLSGAPVAIKVEQPTAAVAPQETTPAEPATPVAAPRTPVSTAPTIINPPPASNAPTPVGSGGFVLE